MSAKDDLIREAQAILAKHIEPDSGRTAEQTINALLELLDGPRARKAQWEEHRQRHVELHRALDELIADYYEWEMETRPGKERFSNTTIDELATWSNQQQHAAEPWLPRGRKL